jgi:hypothetical protein
MFHRLAPAVKTVKGCFEQSNPSLVHPTPARQRHGRQRRNELLEVVQLALIVSRRQLNDYSCPKSKHTFTQPQLLTCLILKTFKKLSYRGTTELLEDSDALRAAIGLTDVTAVPAHTTLKQFADRVLSPLRPAPAVPGRLALARRELHQRDEADVRLDLGGAQRAGIEDRSGAQSPGLRHPALGVNVQS